MNWHCILKAGPPLSLVGSTQGHNEEACSRPDTIAWMPENLKGGHFSSLMSETGPSTDLAIPFQYRTPATHAVPSLTPAVARHHGSLILPGPQPLGEDTAPTSISHSLA